MRICFRLLLPLYQHQFPCFHRYQRSSITAIIVYVSIIQLNYVFKAVGNLESCTTQQLLNSPLDGEVPQIRVVLANADEQNRNIGGMYDADQSPDHVSDGVAFRDDEPVQGTTRSKSRVEVPGLSNGVCADKCL